MPKTKTTSLLNELVVKRDQLKREYTAVGDAVDALTAAIDMLEVVELPQLEAPKPAPKKRTNTGRHRVVCQNPKCGRSFLAQHRDRMYCSGKCGHRARALQKKQKKAPKQLPLFPPKGAVLVEGAKK